jgi:hypothetical protein
VFVVVAVIGAIVFYSQVIKAGQDKLAQINNDYNSSQTNIQTYRKKGGKLKEAVALNAALKDKLSSLDYLFLADQSSVIPYYEDVLLRLLDASDLTINSDSKLVTDPYTFQINMLSTPFNTLPNTSLFSSIYNLFKIDYLSEVNGTPPPVLDTRPSEFLTPYTVTIENVGGTYNDMKRFIASLQSKTNDTLITVHCFKNDDSKNAGVFRTSTQWKITTTVYFMNPEKPANGDEPPMKPGEKSC